MNNASVSLEYNLYYNPNNTENSQYISIEEYIKQNPNLMLNLPQLKATSIKDTTVDRTLNKTLSHAPWSLAGVHKEGVYPHYDALIREYSTNYRVEKINGKDQEIIVETLNPVEFGEDIYHISMHYDNGKLINIMVENAKTKTEWNFTMDQTGNVSVDREDAPEGLLDFCAHIMQNGTVAGYNKAYEIVSVLQPTMAYMVRILSTGSMNFLTENNTAVTDVNGKYVYTDTTTIVFPTVENAEEITNTAQLRNLPLGNYKLVGTLRVDGVRVAEDYLIFNVNRAEIFDLIQESNAPKS